MRIIIYVIFVYLEFPSLYERRGFLHHIHVYDIIHIHVWMHSSDFRYTVISGGGPWSEVLSNMRLEEVNFLCMTQYDAVWHSNCKQLQTSNVLCLSIGIGRTGTVNVTKLVKRIVQTIHIVSLSSPLSSYNHQRKQGGQFADTPAHAWK